MNCLRRNMLFGNFFYSTFVQVLMVFIRVVLIFGHVMNPQSTPSLYTPCSKQCMANCNGLNLPLYAPITTLHTGSWLYLAVTFFPPYLSNITISHNQEEIKILLSSFIVAHILVLKYEMMLYFNSINGQRQIIIYHLYIVYYLLCVKVNPSNPSFKMNPYETEPLLC